MNILSKMKETAVSVLPVMAIVLFLGFTFVPLDKFWNKLDAIAAASSGNGPVINVYATPDMNVNELATKIEQILVRQQKQRSMAYGGI